MPRPFRFALAPAMALLAGLLVSAGSSGIAPAQAQGTLTAPAGQARVTAPGGVRGRAVMRQRRLHHRRR